MNQPVIKQGLSPTPEWVDPSHFPTHNPQPENSKTHIALGNDLVDLAALSPRAKRLAPRYLQKVCTEAEIPRIQAAEDSALMLATHWAAKEAAYKAYVQLGGRRYFGPKDFELSLSGSNSSGKISSPFGHFQVIIFPHPAYVHAIAWHGELSPFAYQVISLHSSSKSLRSNELKQAFFQETLGRGLSLHKTEQGVPFLCQDGQRLPLSFSHDGNWGAWVYG